MHEAHGQHLKLIAQEVPIRDEMRTYIREHASELAREQLARVGPNYSFRHWSQVIFLDIDGVLLPDFKRNEAIDEGNTWAAAEEKAGRGPNTLDDEQLREYFAMRDKAVAKRFNYKAVNNLMRVLYKLSAPVIVMSSG